MQGKEETMVRVESARPAEGLQVQVRFTDGTEAVLDLDPLFRGPIFEPLREDRAQFEAMQVDPELGTLVWQNGADLCSDVLYMHATGKTPEDLFPRLHSQPAGV